jgi:hypothetical protein
MSNKLLELELAFIRAAGVVFDSIISANSSMTPGFARQTGQKT